MRLGALSFRVGLALFGAVALPVGNARADEVRAASAARASVRVRLVGELGREAALESRIVSWFDAAALELKVESAPRLETRDILAPDGGVSVQVWVTRRGPKLARLYFATRSPETGKVRYLLRDLELERGLDEVAAEALAQSVHLSTLALLEGQLESSRAEVEQALQAEAEPAPAATVESARPEAVSSPASPEVAEAREREAIPSRFVLVPALGYGLEFRGDEGLAHGPRLRLHAGLPSGWGLEARLQLSLPHRERRPELELELWGGSALLGVGYRERLHPLWTLAMVGGASLELVRYSTRALPGSAFVPGPPARELRPRAVLGGLVAFGSAPRVALVTELGISLGRTSYESARAGQRREVAVASWLTPNAGLELEL